MAIEKRRFGGRSTYPDPFQSGVPAWRTGQVYKMTLSSKVITFHKGRARTWKQTPMYNLNDYITKLVMIDKKTGAEIEVPSWFGSPTAQRNREYMRSQVKKWVTRSRGVGKPRNVWGEHFTARNKRRRELEEELRRYG